jgi:hypothetical protein
MPGRKRKTVQSREYKIMLRARRFGKGEQGVLESGSAFWRDFCANADNVGIESMGDLDKIKTRRLITFFDTAKQHLNRSSYIFRERQYIDSEEREVTLKFRHADRFVAEDRSMDAANPKGAQTKFEEDIKAPFRSLYSFSTTLAMAGKPPRNLGEMARLIPDVAGRLEGFRRSEPLTAVNSFTAREVVVVGGSIRLSKQPKVSAECALIVWYDNSGRETTPVAVEFSYRYGNKNEEYDGTSALRAFDTLNLLQMKLKKWTDPKGATKTAFVYG